MFLFNPYRNARQNFACGDEIVKINWKSDLRTSPIFGAESTAVLDDEGNIYFGSHSGNFYSLTKNGDIRWVFTTKKKIYSSPILVHKRLFFAGGDGVMYSLASDDGKLLWKTELSKSLDLTRRKKILLLIKHLPYTFDVTRRKNITYGSWASPNLIGNKIFVTGFGKGLFCFSLDGDLLWEYDLGFPRFQLSGVVIDSSNRVYCASRKGYIHCFSDDGKLIWKKKIKSKWEPWGNPVYCDKNHVIYCSYSLKERSGFVYKINTDGDIQWKIKIGAIRGSIAIQGDAKILYCGDLDGYLYKIEASTGNILIKEKLTNCPRGLWTTPTLDSEENILISTKDGPTSGRVIKLDQDFNFLWAYETNKVLSVPVVLSNGDVLFGSWDGAYYSIKTKR